MGRGMDYDKVTKLGWQAGGERASASEKLSSCFWFVKAQPEFIYKISLWIYSVRKVFR